LPNGTRVAIVAFTTEHTNLSNYIMDELTGVLVDGRLEVADRRNLEFVYKEMGFQMSGDVSDETAVSIGKYFGARYVITEQLVKAGDRYRYRLSGINVETAVQESSTRLNVRNDRTLQSLVSDVRQTPAVTASAGYGERQNTQPTTVGTYLDRGILFLSRNDWDMAIADYTQAIRLNPNLAAAYDGRGFAYYQKGEYDRAIADYTQAIKLVPNNTVYSNNLAKTYDTRGFMYYNKRDYELAIADYNQAIKLDPDNTVYTNNLAKTYDTRGFMYYTKRDYDRSIADYEKALQIAPNNTTYRNNLEIARRWGR
jgi:tetratricopeptide (TPR) repeat protein